MPTRIIDTTAPLAAIKWLVDLADHDVEGGDSQTDYDMMSDARDEFHPWPRVDAVRKWLATLSPSLEDQRQMLLDDIANAQMPDEEAALRRQLAELTPA